MTTENIELVHWRQGHADIVISLDDLAEMLRSDQLVYMNGRIAARMMGNLADAIFDAAIDDLTDAVEQLK